MNHRTTATELAGADANDVKGTLSYVQPTAISPWGTYLTQVDRVVPYLGPLARWAETLKRPKRALIVDIPVELDNGAVHRIGLRTAAFVVACSRILTARQERGLYP